MEPAIKPMAGQAGAPLHFPFAPAGFQGVYPLVSLWLLSSDQESNITRTSAPAGVIYLRENPAGQKRAAHKLAIHETRLTDEKA